MPQVNYCFKNLKMPHKISQKSYFVSGVFNTNVIFNVFYYANLTAINIFIKWLFWADKKVLPFPPSPQVQCGVGEWGFNWLFLSPSRWFGYGFEALRIWVELSKNLTN
jgi:hypothetical protein